MLSDARDSLESEIVDYASDYDRAEYTMSNAELIAEAREWPSDMGEGATLNAFADAMEAAERDLAAAQEVIAEVKRYAEDREAYGKRGRTVHSARIASDLLSILSQSSVDALQAHGREVAAKALTDAADHLETPRMVWYGDGGVTVYDSEAHVNAGRPMPMRLTDWLRARAAALGVPEEAEHG